MRTTEEKHKERGKGDSYSAYVGLGGFGEGFGEGFGSSSISC